MKNGAKLSRSNEARLKSDMGRPARIVDERVARPFRYALRSVEVTDLPKPVLNARRSRRSEFKNSSCEQLRRQQPAKSLGPRIIKLEVNSARRRLRKDSAACS